MTEVLTTALGFFAVIFVGYFMKSKGILKLEDKDLLGKILLNVCLPSVIVMSFQGFVFDSSLIAAFFLGMLANILGVFTGFALTKKADHQTRGLFMFLSAGYNIGIFTIPFVSSFFSSAAVLSVMIFDVGNAIFVMGTTAAIVGGLLNNERGNPLPSIAKKMLKSVNIWAYIVMITLVTLGIPIPSAVFSVFSIPASATSCLAMLMVGIMLEFKINSQEKKELFSLLLVRFGYSFLVAACMYFLLPFDLEVRKALMIGVLSPMSTASMVFAQDFGCKPSIVGGAGTFAILISMVLIVSVSLL